MKKKLLGAIPFILAAGFVSLIVLIFMPLPEGSEHFRLWTVVVIWVNSIGMYIGWELGGRKEGHRQSGWKPPSR